MKRSIAAIAGIIILTSCANNPVEFEDDPPPAPQAPTVTINVKQDSITAGQPVSIEVCGTRFSQIAVSPGGFVVARCDTLTDYPQRPTRYRAFASGPGGNAQASDSVTVRQPVTPPAPTTATGWITANVYPARADSMWKYSPSGERTTTQVGKALPYNGTLTADGSLYVFWTSASGHYPEPVAVNPEAGKPFDRMATLRIVPPAPPTPPTTETVLIAASLSRVAFVVDAIQPDGSWKRLFAGRTDTVAVLPEGHYRATFTAPDGYLDAPPAFTDVKPGNPANPLVAVFAKKPEPPAPPPAPITIGKLLTSCTVAGVNTTVRKYGGTAVIAVTDSVNLEQGFYWVKWNDPSGKYKTDSTTVAINAGQRTTVNCPKQEVAPPPPPPPPPTTGNLFLTAFFDGKRVAVEMKVWKVERIFVGDFITDTTLTNRSPGEYFGECVKPGSNGRIVGTARVVLGAGETKTLRCDMRELPPDARTILRIHSDPVGMLATVWRRVGEEWKLVGDERRPTNFTLEDVEPGRYKVLCAPPTDNTDLLPADLEIEVPRGETTTALCVMPRKR